MKALLNLFSFRNRSEAFDLEGTTEIETPTAHSIVIKRQNKDKSVTAVVEIDLQNQTYRVIENGFEVSFWSLDMVDKIGFYFGKRFFCFQIAKKWYNIG